MFQKNEVVGSLSNREAEESLLGHLIYSGSSGNRELEKVFSILEGVTLLSEFGNHFYEDAHRKVYAALYLNYSKQRPISSLSLAYSLSREDCFQNDAAGTEAYLDDLKRKACYDHQAEELTRQIIDLSRKRQLSVVAYDFLGEIWGSANSMSSDELVSGLEKSLTNLIVSGDYRREARSVGAIGESVLAKIQENRGKGLTGISSGYTQLDNLLGGFQNSDLMIVAARPGMGKTSFALCLALSAAEDIRKKSKLSGSETAVEGERNKIGSVGFISLEMSGEQLVSRLIAIKTGLNLMKLRSARLNDDELDKVVLRVQNFDELNVIIDDSAALSIVELRSKARRMVMKHNLRILLVDYLQLLSGSKKSSEANRVNEISEISRGLKQLAKELNIPVIAMSQLSRDIEKREDKKPRLSDLRESGSIEQDADIVMFIHRDEYYLKDKQPNDALILDASSVENLEWNSRESSENNSRIAPCNNFLSDTNQDNTYEEIHDSWKDKMDSVLYKAKIIIAKHRNGPNGEVELRFDHSTTEFIDPEKYRMDESSTGKPSENGDFYNSSF